MIMDVFEQQCLSQLSSSCPFGAPALELCTVPPRQDAVAGLGLAFFERRIVELLLAYTAVQVAPCLAVDCDGASKRFSPGSPLLSLSPLSQLRCAAAQATLYLTSEVVLLAIPPGRAVVQVFYTAAPFAAALSVGVVALRSLAVWRARRLVLEDQAQYDRVWADMTRPDEARHWLAAIQVELGCGACAAKRETCVRFYDSGRGFFLA